MSTKLQVIVNGKMQSTHDLEDGVEYVIGRGTTCDIVINDRSVSHKHCSVKAVKGGIECVDLGSTNGLYVGGVQHKRIVIREGAEPLNLGMAQLRILAGKSHTGMIPIFLEGFPSDLDSVSEQSSGIGLFGPRTPAPPARRPVEPAQSVFDSDASQSGQTRLGNPSDYRGLAKERLALLIDTAKSLAQSTELEHLLTRILDHLFELMRVKRAVVALSDDGEHFYARVVRPQGEIESLSSVSSQGILKRVYSERKGVIIEDASLDQALKANLSIVSSNIKAAICVPILANQRCFGVIYADYPGVARIYTSEDLEFMNAFASIAAVSVENHRVLQRLRDNDRVQRDLEIASDVQKSLLPSNETVFNFPGLEIDWTYWPSCHIGGDFFDVMQLDQNRVAVLIGDVSGKSIPAALYMAQTLSFMRAIVANAEPPGATLTRVNALLGEKSGERQVFATATMLLIEPQTGRVVWSSAGHNPMLVWTAEDQQTRRLEADGVPLGVDETWVYHSHEFTVPPRTVITLYTDGLVEARNIAGKEFGMDEVSRIVTEHADLPIEVMTNSMIQNVKSHIIGSPYADPYRRDDIAIVNIRLLGPS